MAASDGFYTALGYRQVGSVDSGHGRSLTMVKFPGERVVTGPTGSSAVDGPVDISAPGSATLSYRLTNSRNGGGAVAGGAQTRPGRAPRRSRWPPRPHGSQTPTANGLSWSSGHPATLQVNRY